MPKPTEEAYFEWLYSWIDPTANLYPNNKTYWHLAKKLHSVPFIAFVKNDDNRAEDGKDLRYEWMTEHGAVDDHFWLDLDCSVLELLIALGERMEFETDITSYEWIWFMLRNLRIDGYDDHNWNRRTSSSLIGKALDTFINRSYSRNGEGGLFPLTETREDQRTVEIWYQMSAYILEQTSY